MVQRLKKIKEWNNVDKKKFHNEILPTNQPAILKGLVSDWPSVSRAKESNQSIVEYMINFEQGLQTTALISPPEVKGRFDYQPDMKRFNFERSNQPLRKMLEDLINLAKIANPPAFSIQGIDVEQHFIGFSAENKQSLLEQTENARAWIGNRTTTRTHYDHVDNLACVVAGHRKFTLFPPEQVSNLYVGPLLSTPAGPSVSLVDLAEPDLVKYPKFENALSNALEAELEPGDAIYIPYFWWHNVESLDEFNILVNYWWNQGNTSSDIPYQCLLQSMLSIPQLPAYKRKIWRKFFDHYVFQLDGSPGEHLPDDLQDIVTSLSPEHKEKMKKMISASLLQ